jgi:predicted DNA-binding transcriptional regulator AlpA
VILDELEKKYTGKSMLSRREVAEFLGVTITTLNNLAKKNTGPKYLRVGKTIRYSISSLAEYIAENES